MTPKERAFSLYFQFIRDVIANENKAKQCAIITIDNILLNFEGMPKPEYCIFDSIGKRKFLFNGEYEKCMTGYDMIEYWNEVKEEIKNI